MWGQYEFVEQVSPSREFPAESATTSQPRSATGGSTTTSQPPVSSSGEVRLGCGTYCQAAGILNGGAGGGHPAVTIVSSRTATADADGYAPVVLTCNLTVQCRGSLVLSLYRPGFPEQGHIAGKSDVVVDAAATTTLGVPLDAVALSWLRSHGSTDFSVIVDAGLSFGCDGMAWAPDSPTRSGLPPCGDRPINGFAVLSASSLSVAAPRTTQLPTASESVPSTTTTQSVPSTTTTQSLTTSPSPGASNPASPPRPNVVQ